MRCRDEKLFVLNYSWSIGRVPGMIGAVFEPVAYKVISLLKSRIANIIYTSRDTHFLFGDNLRGRNDDLYQGFAILLQHYSVGSLASHYLQAVIWTWPFQKMILIHSIAKYE